MAANESCCIVKESFSFLYSSLDNLGNRLGYVCDNMIILTHEIYLFVDKHKRDCKETRAAERFTNYRVIYVILLYVLKECIYSITSLISWNLILEILIIAHTSIYTSKSITIFLNTWRNGWVINYFFSQFFFPLLNCYTHRMTSNKSETNKMQIVGEIYWELTLDRLLGDQCRIK